MTNILEDVHAHDVILGDVSPNNVLVDPSNLNVRMIDVESATGLHETSEFASFSRLWRTPGFRQRTRYERGESLAPKDDWYALGMLLQSLLIPIEGLVDMCPDAAPRFHKRYVDAGLPPFVVAVIQNLLAGNVAGAYEALK